MEAHNADDGEVSSTSLFSVDLYESTCTDSLIDVLNFGFHDWTE